MLSVTNLAVLSREPVSAIFPRLMKKIIVFGFVVFLCGCGKVRKLGEAAPYVEAFESASQAVGRPINVDNLVIEFGKTSGLAVCERGGGSTPRITISPGVWKNASED